METDRTENDFHYHDISMADNIMSASIQSQDLWTRTDLLFRCLSLLRSPYVIGQTIIFLPCDFYILLLFSPRLISAVGDWMSTILPHMVWP